MEHTILFTRPGELDTNALIKLCTPDAITAEVAFARFNRRMRRLLTTTAYGKVLEGRRWATSTSATC